MNQNQIDIAARETDLLADILDDTSAKKPVQMINLYGETSPAILAGILSCGVATIYQYRQDGKLPPNSDASYRDSIRHFINYWKTAAVAKANNISEQATIQKIKLDEAKTEQAWLQIKKERGELVDTKILAETFEPYFLQMRMQIVSIGRKHPEIQPELDKLLAHWSHLGKELMNVSQQKLDDFIQVQMEKEVHMEKTDVSDL